LTAAATAPRLPLVDTPDDALARRLLDEIAAGRGILNLHRMMAHAPALMKANSDMALALRHNASLPRATAELAILRTAQATDCGYVWARHLPLARAAGVSEPMIAAIAGWPQSEAFTPAQKAALAFAEATARGTPLSDEAFAALRRNFSPREIVELTMLVGFYVSTTLFIKALAVPDDKA
jgi:AhpD family alkylhydroperoxidase